MQAIRFLRSFITRYEWLLFAIGVVLAVSDVFATRWMLTEDGPSHLYNAVITKELFIPGNPFFHQHFILTHLPIPNLLGHVLLMFFSSFLPLSVCDQLIHFIYMAGLCYSFRFLVIKINPEKKYHSWLIFPFAYSTIFNFGFYNYSLGVALCLFCIGIWLSLEDQLTNKKRLIFLFTLTISMGQKHYRKNELAQLNAFANRVENFAPYVHEGHTGIYIANVSNWMELHIGDVVFAEKNVCFFRIMKLTVIIFPCNGTTACLIIT